MKQFSWLWSLIEKIKFRLLEAHDVAVRSMVWSHNDQWMVTADHDGFIKYWQANMNNVKMFQAHKEAVRSIRYSIIRPNHARIHEHVCFSCFTVNEIVWLSFFLSVVFLVIFSVNLINRLRLDKQH